MQIVHEANKGSNWFLLIEKKTSYVILQHPKIKKNMSLRGSLPSEESLSLILRLSWSSTFLMYVIPVHSIKQSVCCVTLLGSSCSSFSFSEHTTAPAASSRGASMPKDTHTLKYLDIMSSRLSEKHKTDQFFLVFLFFATRSDLDVLSWSCFHCSPRSISFLRSS